MASPIRRRLEDKELILKKLYKIAILNKLSGLKALKLFQYRQFT